MRKNNKSQPAVKQEADDGSAEYNHNVDKLWAIIQSMPKHEKKKVIDSLDEKTITALRVRRNPYRKPVFMGKTNKTLAFSMINITEKDAQRFAMTSLIGFLYRMLDEYKPKGHENFVSENDPQFAMPFNEMVRELRKHKPNELLMDEFEKIKKKIEELKHDTTSKEYKEAAKESFIVRAKIYKNKIYWTREDLALMKEKKESLEREVKHSDTRKDDLLKSIQELNEKKAKKQKFEEGRLNMSKGTPESIESGQIPEGLKVEDILKKMSNYVIEIENKEKLVEKETAKNDELRKELELRVKQCENYEEHLKTLENKFKDLKVDFLKKTGRSKLAADLIREGKSNTRKKTVKKELKTELDEVMVDKYEPNDDDYDSIVDKIKKKLNIEKTSEEYTIEIQNQVEQFLDEYLRYNPDNHVRCAYKPNYDDPQRTPLEKTQEKDLQEKNYERTVIPPDDTFFRWKRYTEANYECLRQATDDIYCEKFDLEYAIVPLQEFTGEDKEEVMKKFNDFKLKYASEFDSEIFSADFGVWNLLSSWEQNREVRDFYTEKTEIIKRIIDQHKSDERMGISLMKDRAKKKKEENEAKEGPHDPALHQYRKSLKPNEQLETHGAKYIDEIDNDDFSEDGEIRADRVPRDTEESTKQEVEVGVHVIKPYIGGGRRRIPRGLGENWKFNIPAQELPEGSVKLFTGPEFQQENEDLINNFSI
jgi:hypothetical protein